MDATVRDDLLVPDLPRFRAFSVGYVLHFLTARIERASLLRRNMDTSLMYMAPSTGLHKLLSNGRSYACQPSNMSHFEEPHDGSPRDKLLRLQDLLVFSYSGPL